MKSSNTVVQYVFISIAVIIFFAVIIVAGSKSPKWEESYDNSLISRNEALDISHQSFALLLAHGIISKENGNKPNGYYLKLFQGEPGEKFVDYFKEQSSPKVMSGTGFKSNDYFSWGMIHVKEFKHLSKSMLVVKASMSFYKNDKELEITFERVKRKWNIINLKDK